MQNNFQKIFLFLGLLTNQFLLPISVVAQETTPIEPTPTEVVSPTPTEAVTITLAPTETPVPEITPTPEAVVNEIMSIAPVATESSYLVVIEIGNSATVDQLAIADSNTGLNTVTTVNNDTQVSTGNAVSVGNIVNLINNTSVESLVKVYLLNSVSGETTELDLNNLWRLLESEQNGTGNTNPSFVNISNFAQVSNLLNVSANTGGNTIDGNNSVINTGNAYALANIINLVNTNFVGSRVFVGVLNIDASNLGDIILPNPESFTNNDTNYGLGEIQISNSANINTITLASANTGNNNMVGVNPELNTGNAVSVTNVSTTANLNLLNSSQMMLTINTLGNWSGEIYNWANAGAVQTGVGGMFVSNGQPVTVGNMDVNIFNIAQILNLVGVQANTGNNLIAGNNSSINTGNAYALANVSNLANINIIGSDWFYGMINVIGDWKGNAIFAYPDMTSNISVSKDLVNVGDELLVKMNWKNEGYDDANKVSLTLSLPYGLEYLGDNSGKTVIRNGSSLLWDMGKVGAKKGGSFMVKVRASQTDEEQLLITSNVSTINTEVTLDNNSDEANTKIVRESQNQNVSYNLNPKLVIDMKNNVNDFVYDGDVVTYQVDARNEGEAKANQTFIIHKVFDQNKKLVSQNRINLGDVAIGGKGKVTFGIRVLSDKGQKFTTETVWVGSKENGDEISSNVSTTEFLAKTRMVNTKKISAPEVLAVETAGMTLGTNEAIPKKNLTPFVIIFIISSTSVLWQIRKWQLK